MAAASISTDFRLLLGKDVRIPLQREGSQLLSSVIPINRGATYRHDSGAVRTLRVSPVPYG